MPIYYFAIYDHEGLNLVERPFHFASDREAVIEARQVLHDLIQDGLPFETGEFFAVRIYDATMKPVHEVRMTYEIFLPESD